MAGFRRCWSLALAGSMSFALWGGPLSARPAAAQVIDDPRMTLAERDQLLAEIAEDNDALQRHLRLLKKVVQVIRPSVVHIETRKIERVGSRIRSTPVEEAGSGVVISMGGKYYVLTNRHVVKDSELTDIKVSLVDGRQLRATQIWSDSGADVAVVALGDSQLVPARLGDSNDLEIGDFVLAVGSPFGLSHSVTYGIISAKGRRNLELGDSGVRYQDFLQTDAAINPGNSGGPLVNLRGEVVGINTAIASASGGNEGIGFTIPINMAMFIARQLIEKGNVDRAFLGVHMDSKFGAEAAARLGLPRPMGARVSGITPRSPAEAAGLQVGDIILQFGQMRIDDDTHLVNVVSLTPVETDVDLTLLREGKLVQLKVRVGDRARFSGN